MRPRRKLKERGKVDKESELVVRIPDFFALGLLIMVSSLLSESQQVLSGLATREFASWSHARSHLLRLPACTSTFP